jgi:transposase
MTRWHYSVRLPDGHVFGRTSPRAGVTSAACATWRGARRVFFGTDDMPALARAERYRSRRGLSDMQVHVCEIVCARPVRGPGRDALCIDVPSLLAARANGTRAVDIAANLHVSASTVRARIRRAVAAGAKNPRAAPVRDAAMVAAYAGGGSLRDVATQFAVSRGVVAGVIYRARNRGVHVPPRRPGRHPVVVRTVN